MFRPRYTVYIYNQIHVLIPHKIQLIVFLEGLGYVCPNHFNPADFALQLVSSKTVEAHAAAKEKIEAPLLVPSPSGLKIAEAWSKGVISSCSGVHNAKLLQPDDKHKQVIKICGSRASFWVLFKMNLWREYAQGIRAKLMIFFIIATLALGFLIGWVYYQKIPVRRS